MILCLFGLLLFTLTFGVKNIKRTAILETFGKEQADEIEAKAQIASEIPNLFTSRFYALSEKRQVEEAEKFWISNISPIAKRLRPTEMAEMKEELFASIHRMNHASAPPVQPASPK